MTVLCSGNPSQIIPGTERFLIYATGGAFLFAKVPGFAWLTEAGAILGPLTYDLMNFCQVDPPGFQTYTQAEVTAFLGLTFGADYNSFLSKTRQNLDTIVWHLFCQCTIVATPALPVPPPQPTDINYVTAGPTSLPCASYSWDQASSHAPNSATLYSSGSGAFPIPAGATLAVADIQTTACGVAPGTTYTYSLRSWNPFPAIHNTATQTIAPGGAATLTIPITAADNLVQVFCNTPVNTGETCFFGQIQFYCAGATPSALPSPCCPTDPVVITILRSLNDQVNLLQRQLLPFAYIHSTIHAGLNGSGSLAVSDLIGVQLDVTTTPGYTGVEAANPNILFDIGWISVLTADGLIDQRRIQSTHTVWQPRLMAEATVVGYYLNPGVVATITELVREP